MILLCSACAYIKPATNPIGQEYFQYDSNSKLLVVLLPGIGESSRSFMEHGFVKQLHACRPSANIVGVDAYYSYYRRDIIARRLHHDVILPAREQGIEEVWFVGLSLGGLGTLIHRQNYPQDMDAAILMAPYLGDEDDFYEFLEGKTKKGDKDMFVELWQSLSESVNQHSAISLAYGESDTYSKQQSWLASLMQNNRVVTREGGHVWTVWGKLWPQVLQLSGFCQ